ncbi:signal peptidase [Chlamydia trachomatis]|uniref:signal peptidase I n=1 Tax=Chlamydia trachomatis TaxID=813 RepID=UPI00038DCCE0|nr:signal peptidase I [Chlamydia trachomatis]AGT71431.1 signal peptidase [Chlamydia trachomatis]
MTSSYMSRLYSLNKSRRILHSSFRLLKSIKMLSHPETQKELQEVLKQLEEAILDQNREDASLFAKQAQAIQKRFPKSKLRTTFDLIYALTFAAILAFLIRQFWFELYEVPTGSMRPTILEQDRILVSKTTFGLRLPFSNRSIGYTPEAITRGELVVFTVGDLPIPNADTKYFGIIPGKKRYIKRCMGKPGDTVYFYGGKIYGIDCDGEPIFPQNTENLYHVPYISFDGTPEILTHSEEQTDVIFNQFHTPCGKISLPQEASYGQFFYKNSWHNDTPYALKDPHNEPVSYADLFGIKNFAMVRILTKKQAALTHVLPSPLSDTYLEIAHTPNVSYPHPHLRPFETQLIPTIEPMKTLLPLRKEHIHLIRNNLTTSRFTVVDGYAYKYQPAPMNTSGMVRMFALPMPNIPDGCYEFSKGDVFKINMGGFRTKLKQPHPLTQLSNSQVIDLFNCGISFHTIYIPKNPQYAPFPNRYAFFNQGNLFVMDSPVFIDSDPALQKFIVSEEEKELQSSEDKPYIAFIDRGPPPESTEEFVSFITNFGLKIPEGHVLVLGDNCSMSADSRDFGFVPVENLLGSPVGIFWPINRLGLLSSNITPLSLPGYLVNGLALGAFLYCIGLWYYRKNHRLFP